MIGMADTYAMDPPWLWFAGRCGPARAQRSWTGPGRASEDWWTAMTARTAVHGPHPFGPWAPFAGPPPFGPQWGRGWRGGKARRGDVRAAILSVLADSSRNGYQIIQEIAERSGGAWKPSPGSIYPTLQQLEDEGLVRADASDGKRTYSLTEDGQTYVAEHADEVSAPWQGMPDQAPHDDGMRPLIGQIAAAIWQIASVGTAEQQAKGKAALIELRRKLHAILADTDTGTDGDAGVDKQQTADTDNTQTENGEQGQ